MITPEIVNILRIHFNLGLVWARLWGDNDGTYRC